MKTCGSCNLCCKLLGIGELKKPAGKWCPHVKLGVGCSIYKDRPSSCQEFQCFWIVDPNAPDNERPDKVHAFLASLESATPEGYTRPPGELVTIYVDPTYPLAHTQSPIVVWADKLARKGFRVIAIVGPKAYSRKSGVWLRARTELRGDVCDGVFDVFLE